MNAVSRLTAKELNLAARTVFAEAATEGLNGQMAVAQTMYDQLHHNIIGADGSGFGKTLEEVIKNACGEFDPTAYTDYLVEKYTDIYKLVW